MLTARERQRQKRDDLFLMGPIMFGWIISNIPDPTSRLILVAEAIMKMKKPRSVSLELRRNIWDCAGIGNKDQRARVSTKIDTKVEGYRIESRPGRVSVLHKIPDKSKKA